MPDEGERRGAAAPTAGAGGPFRRNFGEVREIDVSEQGHFYVLALHDGRFVKVSHDVKAVVDHLVAGVTDPTEVARRLRRDEVAELAPEDVARLIGEVLVPREIVLRDDGAPPRGLASKGSRLWAHLPLFDGRHLAAFGDRAAVLFTPHGAWTVFAVWLAATATLLARGGHQVLLSSGSFRFSVISFLLVVLPATAFHELGHALSCYRYGVRARKMGIGLYLFRPVLYTDMSETWLLGRSKRVVTDLAGTYFGWIYATGVTIAAAIAPSPALLWALVVLYVGAAANLNPFIRFDGYWVLTDLTGVVNVHFRALALVRYLAKRLVGLRPPKPDLPVLAPRVRRALVGLSALYLAFTALLVALALRTVAALFFEPGAAHRFFQPFIDAVQHASPIELLGALRSGGLVSVVLLYLLIVGLSTMPPLLARLRLPLPRRRVSREAR